jgi:hypothetical protein
MIPPVMAVAPLAETTGMASTVEESATSDVIIHCYGIYWDSAP